MKQNLCSLRRGVHSAGAVLLLVCALAGNVRGAYYSTPTLPNINTNFIINVTNNPAHNAVPDNATDNTLAISNAIALAAAGGLTNGAAGGTVEIPAGAKAYLCGPITMKSAVNLQIDAGAVLRMLPFGTYPGNASFIGATNLTDVEISGSGAVDGQGLAWWTYFATNSSLSRPILVRIQGCSRQLVQNVTLSNAPMFHMSFSSSKGNITVRNVTVQSPSSEASPPAANTDACDVSGTNILVENCHISEGDDDFTCSGGTSGVLLTNNTYGTGHGISIGSYTSGGVSNITVINCTINGADNGLRIKSDNDRGGVVQNINYCNIGITNVHFPIQIYSYYNEIGTPSSITPYYASTQTVDAVSGTTPIYCNITFSNITATSVSGYPIGIIWARTELPATNIIFNKVNITGDRSFDLYNVSGAQFIDCNLQPSSTYSTFKLYDAQAIFTNSAPAGTPFTLDGLTTNGYFNALALYNASGSLANTNVLGNGPLTLAASTLTVSNNLSLQPSTVVNFILGTNTTRLAVTGSLTLGGTNNFTAGNGFSNGTYTVMTGGTLTGSLPALGSLPAGFGYSYSLITNTSGQVNLVATLPAPTNFLAAATNLQVMLNWNAVSGATNYNLKRGTSSGGPYPTAFSKLAATNYADAAVTNRVSYYYVVTALGAGGESSNSVAVSAIPLPSKQPTNLVMRATNGQLQLSWPQDHQGWRLQIQTNTLAAGLAPNPTNWATVPNSTNVMATNVVINPTNGSVFLRLIYP
jgi:hypothetical protein